MALLAVLAGTIVAALTGRLRPALVTGLSTWVLVTLWLTLGVRLQDDTATQPEHSLTAGFWVAQVALLGATIGATVLTARLRERRALQPR